MRNRVMSALLLSLAMDASNAIAQTTPPPGLGLRPLQFALTTALPSAGGRRKQAEWNKTFRHTNDAASPSPAKKSGKTCARGVVIGAALGAGLGLASGYVAVASAGGSDSYAAILRGTTLAALGVGAFVDTVKCP